MWSRFKRAMRSLFGSAVDRVEDPERILQQNLRDMTDEVPRMNENIALVRANLSLLEREGTRLVAERRDLQDRIRASLRTDRDDLAGKHALRLQAVERDLVRNEGQITTARAAYEKALQVKKVFLREREARSQEAMRAIRDHRRAQWQARVADALESFQVAGIDATHDEMVRKLDERTALTEARMQMALDSVDAASIAVEEEVEAARARELLQQMRKEMGLPAMVEAEPIRLPQRIAQKDV